MSFSLEDIVQATYDLARESMIDDYNNGNGKSITELARATGWSRETVYRRLTKAGVYTRPGKSGPQRKEKCSRDHDMEVHGVDIPPEKGGGRYCGECKRMRQRVGWKNGEGE